MRGAGTPAGPGAEELEARILAALPDAVVVADLEGRIVACNPAAESLAARSPGDLVGTKLEALLSRRPLEPQEFVTLGGAERADVVVRLGEEGRRSAVAATRILGAGGEHVGTVGVVKAMGSWLDPAEAAGGPRREWHHTLGGIVRELVAVAKQGLAAIDDSAALAGLLVGQARRLVPDAEVMLSVVPRERQERFEIVAAAGPWAELQVGRSWPQGVTIAGRSLIRRRTIETVRLDELTGLRETVLAGDIKSARLVPLLAPRPLPDGRTAFGTLGFYRRERRYFTPYERRLIDEFCRLVSVALQRTELRRSASEAAARLGTAVDVALDLGSSLELRGVIRRLLRRVLTTVDADRVTILRVEGDQMTVEDSLDAERVGAPVGRTFALTDMVAAGEPVALQAVRDRRPRISGGYEVLGLEAPHTAGLETLRHTLTLPVLLAGTTIALLVVGRRREQPFVREDALTLQLLGNVAALAIRNARLFADARAASEARSDFLNMAAHELRTPLTVVTGYLSMFADGTFGPPPPAWEQPLALLRAKAAELDRLVDDLLLASDLESGGLAARIERLDLRQAVAQSAHRAEAQVQLVGGELVLDLAEIPVQVRADAEHVGRILDNLVNNAIAYRHPGEPAWVRLEVGTRSGMAFVGVEDRGRGVPVELRERIFERFVRGDEPGAGKTAGTGLGLYISRQLAARHGGLVELESSRPGEGSRFALRLPLIPGDRP